jgi:hypothetical protein
VFLTAFVTSSLLCCVLFFKQFLGMSSEIIPTALLLMEHGCIGCCWLW